ncbi:hypothetical protein WMY93_013384 [Mugilogobius chulae]|uniref:RNA-binding protein 26 n=1 Tax=Mugilogobius chulae TaxID=88201 RepID=A0AAW0P043_9GOBI
MDFRPDRWVRKDTTDHVDNFGSIPFGYGIRSCIGRRIAELEMHLALTRLIQKFRIEVSPKTDDVKAKTHGLLCPAAPINLNPFVTLIPLRWRKRDPTICGKLFEAINSKSYLPQSEQPAPVPKPEKDEPKKDESIQEEDRDKKNSRRLTHSPPQSSSRYRDSRCDLFSVFTKKDDRRRDDCTRKEIMTGFLPEETLIVTATTAEGGAAIVGVVAAAGAKTGFEIATETEIETVTGTEIAHGAGRTVAVDLGAGVEREIWERVGLKVVMFLHLLSSYHLHPRHTSLSHHWSSTITVIAPTHHHGTNNTTESWSEFRPEHPVERGPFTRGPPPPQRKRCRDYDEKGFCMRGDMCPFDHGSDPVVVEDVNLPSILPFQPPPIPGVDPPPPGTLPPSLPPVAGPPPPLPPLQPSGMDAPPNSITSSVPTIVTSGMRPSLPPGPPPIFNPELFDSDVYNPEAPSITNSSRPVYRHRNTQRPNLIGLTMGDVDQPPREKIPNNSMRIVMESDSRKRAAASHDGGILSKKPWFDKPNFNKANHHGYHKRGPFNPSNTKLLQFGTIVNLQVAFQNDPEGALIQFAAPEEAKRAMQSPEAVLNNRFIRVYWYREDSGDQNVSPPATSLKQSVKDRLGPLVTQSPEPTQDSSVDSQNASKLSVKERLGFSAKPAPQVEKVFSTSMGLTKTVYNPVALKAVQKSTEVLKKKQDALKLQQDVRKKKQEILEKHIETQKAQKELLDAELDLYKKTQSGEDTALLKIKYTQLQIEAAKRGILSTGRGRGLHSRGRGALRARGRGVGGRGRGRGVPAHAVVDHRPRALEISGFSDADNVNLLPHFAQFGEIEDCQIDEKSLTAVITYKTRAEAELAAIHGGRLNNQILRLAWHKPAVNLSHADAEDAEQDDEEYPDESLSDDALLQDDDEEDDEPRSWRR